MKWLFLIGSNDQSPATYLSQSGTAISKTPFEAVPAEILF